MARGWESKSVELNIEEAGAAVKIENDGTITASESELRRKREGLDLQRSRILQEMESANKPRYREMLEKMLSHLERELLLCGTPKIRQP